MSTVVIAEKPSVARDIAAALGVKTRKQGYLEGNGWQITWAIGHLVALAQPEEINPQWKRWTMVGLPMLPEVWPLVVLPDTKAQFSIIVSLLKSPHTEKVVCATDAGREGELIFRYIYAQADCTLPVERLWISSLTPAAIRQGFAQLKGSEHYNALADSAIARSRADWLVGMNLSRSYTLANNELLSVGRVQTPTLAMLVARELEIRDFKPEAYSEITAQFTVGDGDAAESYKGLYYVPNEKSYPAHAKNFSYLPLLSRLAVAPAILASIKARALKGVAQVAALRQRQFSMPAPLLYDLTQLQKDANLVYGLSASNTLAAAQALYEEEKLISYPRTDCPYLDEGTAATLAPVLASLLRRYQKEIAGQKIAAGLGRPQVETAKVVEHHAIIPLGLPGKNLGKAEAQVFELIARRLVMAVLPPYCSSMTTVITTIEQATDKTLDYYQSLAKQITDLGWKNLDLRHRKGAADEGKDLLPVRLAPGLSVGVAKASISNKATKPPPYLSEARLLAGMESAGESLAEKELSAAMRQKGLGTPATRAQIIEVLIKRGYVQREQKTLRPTEKGMRLIAVVDAEVKSPKMTAEWEAALQRISQGTETLAYFMGEISRHVSALVTRVKRKRVEAPAAAYPADLEGVLHKVFRLTKFRPLQEPICRHLVAGGSALVVMPTGAGKSLCYQLPGVMRPGAVLIISPLISLMEDQVSKLRRLGLAAGSIHSGCHRDASRELCRAYLAGQLRYLFIAPERLGLPGFLQLLARQQPALIAIDEAHCISQWGHDFRADYRQLGERLRCFAGVPIIALTATANVHVQEDILAQLGVPSCTSFIGGFRRTNLAIEVVSLASVDRYTALAHFLSDPAHRPAIIYVATRKDAESYAQRLRERFGARPYHAGMSSAERSQVQMAFLGDQIDVIVATVAFGMGIDKAAVRSVVHLALPSTMAGYYQEIGRAGRDGKLSKAILLYSLEDQRMLMFLYRKSYPEVGDLEEIWRSIPQGGIDHDRLVGAEDDRDFVNGVQKLIVHGGLEVGADKVVRRQADGWQKSYRQQKKLRLQQLEEMFAYAESSSVCRMLAVISYFGDRQDSEGACGICDVCTPRQTYFKKVKEASKQDIMVIEALIALLGRKRGWSEGALYKAISNRYRISRHEFAAYLACLVAQGIIATRLAEFKKKGHTIHYKLITLVPHAPSLQVKDLNLGSTLPGYESTEA